MTADFDVDAEASRLVRDGLLNSSEYVVSGAIGILLIPLLLRGLGPRAYGLLVAAAASGSLLGLLDCGLQFAVTREVAASPASRGETARFVGAAGAAYAFLGAAGALILFFLGRPIGAGLRLSSPELQAAPWVFGFAGLSFLADRIAVHGRAVLAGLRRYDACNRIGVFAALLRGGGVLALVCGGAGLSWIAGWQAAASAAAAGALLWTAARALPMRFSLDGFKAIKRHLSFSLTASLADAVSGFYWQAPLLVLGLRGGASWIAKFHVAQKFPLAALAVLGRLSGPLFPAASAHRDPERLRRMLELGGRWLVRAALPLCLVQWILAPALLRTWLGAAGPESARILRLTAAAVFFEAVAAGPLEILWASGAALAPAVILLAAGLLNLPLSVAFFDAAGETGPAWAMLIMAAASAFALFREAARICRAEPSRLAREMLRGSAPTGGSRLGEGAAR